MNLCDGTEVVEPDSDIASSVLPDCGWINHFVGKLILTPSVSVIAVRIPW